MKEQENRSNKARKESNKASREAVSTGKPKLKRSELGKKLLIRGENARKFEEMRSKILAEMAPASEIEKILCEKIISAQWRIGRLQKLESGHLSNLNQHDESYDALTGRDKKRRIRTLDRLPLNDVESKELLKTQVGLENNLYAAIKVLRKEQALRNKHDNEDI
ncbi:MAG: hypothetical protein WD049_05665 [Candidatus Paceibacterota bacterium]